VEHVKVIEAVNIHVGAKSAYVCRGAGHAKADGSDVVGVVGGETAGAHDRKSNVSQTLIQRGKKKGKGLA